MNKPLLLIFGLFLILRLFLIFTFPPVIDEVNYIWWGKLGLSSEEYRFAAIYFWGKQPLPFWIYGVGSFFQDPLVGSRLINLGISSVSFFFLYHLVKNIKSKKAAYFSLLFYALCPAFVLFNSLALVDNFLLSLSISLLWVIFKLWEKFQLKYLILLGILLGISFWVKSTSLILIALSVISLVYFAKKQKIQLSQLLKYLIVLLLVILIIIFPLINHKDYGLISEFNQYFSLSIQELSAFPVSIWFNNTIHFLYTFFIYLTPIPLILLFVLRKKLRQKPFILLLFWFLIPTFSLIFLGKTISFRYFLFSLAPLLPILGILTSEQKINRALVFIPIALISLLLILNPPFFYSSFPDNQFLKTERDYAYSWPSGYGVKEAVDYFVKSTSNKPQVSLALQNSVTSVISPYFLAKYNSDPHFKIFLINTDSFNDFKQIEPLTKNETVFFLSNSTQISNEIKPNLKLIKSFPRPGHEDAINIYHISFNN